MFGKLLRIFLVIALLAGGIFGGMVLVKERQNIVSRALNLGQDSPAPTNDEFKFYEAEDFNQDGLINSQDLETYVQKYDVKDQAADLDNSGEVNAVDYSLFISKMQ